MCDDMRDVASVKPSIALAEHRDAVRAIVLAHRATNPRVFGSTARGEDSTESDLDLLIDPIEGTTLFDLGTMSYELLDLLGVEVDIVTPRALPDRFRDRVLAEAVPV